MFFVKLYDAVFVVRCLNENKSRYYRMRSGERSAQISSLRTAGLRFQRVRFHEQLI